MCWQLDTGEREVRVICLWVFFLFPDMCFAQGIVVYRDGSSFELQESNHVFHSVGEIKAFAMGGVPYRIDISSANGGSLNSYSYSIPYFLYFNDDINCKDISCSSQVSSSASSIFSPLNNDTARLFILISNNPASNMPSGTYTDSLSIDLVVL